MTLTTATPPARTAMPPATEPARSPAPEPLIALRRVEMHYGAVQALAGIDLEVHHGELVAILDVNLIGPWRITAAALPVLRESRGRVVNVASGLAYLAVPLVPAYCMSKRGLTAYSDALRLEHGDAITVTTVYPGYIRTPMHDASEEDGFALEGVVPEERLDAAAKAMARAALGRPVRDLATTRLGGFQYLLLRGAPRRLMDKLTLAVLRREVRRGRFQQSLLARELVQRLS